jgi:hypothetical protein
MTKVLATLLACLTLAASAAAQNDEPEFVQGQCKRLNAFAKKALEKGFPRQAKLIWLQVIKLYDPDNQEAHAAIGEKKIGATWAPDSTFTYPTADTGKGEEGQALFKAYEQLKKDLGSAHRSQAEKWEKAGRTDRSKEHWKLVLRWIDNDKQASEALAQKEIGTLSGSDVEKTLYERSRMIEKAVEEQSRTDYKVEKSADTKNAVLDRSQVKYVTLKSEHFTLHGDPEQEATLADTLKWAERTLKVLQLAFPWPVEVTSWPLEWAFFSGKDTYQQIVKAHADLFPDLKWQLENSTTCLIEKTYIGATTTPQITFDAAVRNVARLYSGFTTAGFGEGIGHTFVGMMFNNNRLFATDRKKQERTVASEQDREFTSPDFDVWKTLSLEMAWKSTGGVQARELPFCDAAAFTNEQRIKAWSFCDYMMRRDPQLLRDMDQLGVKMVNEKVNYEKAFDADHQVSIAQLDKEWEDFWTGATSVLKAIQNNTPPLAAISKGAEKWLQEINALRKEQGMTPVTWSTNLSTRCHDHAIYLKNNKTERGADKEHRESIELGGTHLGSMFAEMAIVDTDAKVGNAKKTFQHWLDIPGYRDLFVNAFQVTVGIYQEGDILVINTAAGIGEPLSRGAGYNIYPRKGADSIPCEIAVADLGPELAALLQQSGKGNLKVVGYPLTMHFGAASPFNRLSFKCRVVTRKGDIPCAILRDGGTIRRTSAPGMFTAYPLEPLPHGEVQAIWSFDDASGTTHTENIQFKTK